MLAHVSDVRGAHPQGRERVRLVDAEDRQVFSEQGGQRRVEPHGGVGDGAFLRLEFRARRLGRPPRAGDQPLGQCRESGARLAPRVEPRGGALGDDVGRLPSLGDDAVRAIPGGELLAKQGDGAERGEEGVQGVDAPLGRGGGVRGAAPEAKAQLREGEKVRLGPGFVRWVHHHGGVHLPEHSGLRHERLAAPALFSGRAEDADASMFGPERLPERRARRRAGDPDDVVRAGVPETGQRVVFGEKRDGGPSRVRPAPVRAERGGQVRHPAREREAFFFEVGAQARRRAMLLEARLRVGVNLEGERPQRVRLGVDELRDGGLGLLNVHARRASGAGGKFIIAARGRGCQRFAPPGAR